MVVEPQVLLSTTAGQGAIRGGGGCLRLSGITSWPSEALLLAVKTNLPLGMVSGLYSIKANVGPTSNSLPELVTQTPVHIAHGQRGRLSPVPLTEDTPPSFLRKWKRPFSLDTFPLFKSLYNRNAAQTLLLWTDNLLKGAIFSPSFYFPDQCK